MPQAIEYTLFILVYTLSALRADGHLPLRSLAPDLTLSGLEPGCSRRCSTVPYLESNVIGQCRLLHLVASAIAIDHFSSHR